ncbi:Ead/Ea22-like family protein [Escherichia coli]
MSNIDKQALRKRYSAKPTPKCDICGARMTIQRMSGSRVTYGCSGAIYDETGCHYAEGRSLADDHYEQSRVTVTDESDPDVLALLDELEAAERERDNWRTSFDNERFRADKLAVAFKTEHEQLVMANGALITQHMRANGAERRISEFESNPIATLDVQSGRDDGNKFALVYSSAAHKLPDNVYYLCAVPAAAGKGE